MGVTTYFCFLKKYLFFPLEFEKNLVDKEPAGQLPTPSGFQFSERVAICYHLIFDSVFWHVLVAMYAPECERCKTISASLGPGEMIPT